MTRKPFLLLAAALFAAPCAQAQFAGYGTVTASTLTGIQSSPRLTPGVSYRDSISPLGFTLGAYYDIHRFGPVTLGADVRFSHMTDKRGAETNSEVSGGRVYSTLGGVRAAIHTPYKILQPYVQGSAGLGRSDYGFLVQAGSTTSVPGGFLDPSGGKAGPVNNLQYNVFAGLDLKVLPVMDVRAFELGYGGLDPFGTYAHNYPLKSVSFGFVFHMPTN